MTGVFIMLTVEACITKQPCPEVLETCAGSNVELTICVEGNPPPQLQWYKEDSPLKNQTRPTITLSCIRLV